MTDNWVQFHKKYLSHQYFEYVFKNAELKFVQNFQGPITNVQYT